MSEKKHELMKYSPEWTRDFYRAIVLKDDGALATMRAALKIQNGEIGNSDFTDLEIHNGVPYCARHRLNVNKEHWTATASELDGSHAWDADGIWFPVEAAK